MYRTIEFRVFRAAERIANADVTLSMASERGKYFRDPTDFRARMRLGKDDRNDPIIFFDTPTSVRIRRFPRFVARGCNRNAVRPFPGRVRKNASKIDLEQMAVLIKDYLKLKGLL